MRDVFPRKGVAVEQCIGFFGFTFKHKEREGCEKRIKSVAFLLMKKVFPCPAAVGIG